MDISSRRSALQAIGGVVFGVGGYLRIPEVPGFYGGFIKATLLQLLIDQDEHKEQLPPSEFVTPYTDDRISELNTLETALQRPGERVELSRREFGNVFTALEKLPVFNPASHEGYDHPAIVRGIYVRYVDYTYLINLQPWCSDSWWIETKGTPDGQSICHRR